MYKRLKHLLPATLLGMVTFSAIAEKPIDCVTTKCFTRRSDSRHKPLQLVGDYRYTHKMDAEDYYGLLSITPAYYASFKPERIANCLFGGCFVDDGCCRDRAIKVQGSAVEGRHSRAWLADYFYLPRNYDGQFVVKPMIKTFTVNFDFFLGLDPWVRNAYVRLYGPFSHTRWDMNFCDTNKTDGAPMDHSCGYFTPEAYYGGYLNDTFRDYIGGGLKYDGSGGVKFKALKYAKITPCSLKDTGFADLRAELGYNFLNCDCARLGVNLQCAFPTGDKKDPAYLFSPMVGNNNHWELGAGFGGHWRMWESEEGDRSWWLIFDANVTHLFKNRQCRTFDLDCKPNSAYMLAAKFGDNPVVTPNLGAGDSLTDAQIGYRSASNAEPIAQNLVSTPAPNKKFAYEYSPVANLTTMNVDVSIAAQADIVVMLNYRHRDFTWDFGYNFWGRSCEKIDCPNSRCNGGTLCDTANINTWALKGDARMFGFQGISSGDQPADVPAVTAIPLSATQSSATIYHGTNQLLPEQLVENNDMTVAANKATGKDINPNVDSAEYAFIASPTDVAGNVGPLSLSCYTDAMTNPVKTDGGRFTPTGDGNYLTLDPATDQIKTSSVPAFLSCSDVNLTRTRGLSHTLFTNLAWQFDVCGSWTPYFGFGAAFEMAKSSCSNCCDSSMCCMSCCDNRCTPGTNSCCNSCIDCGVSQWSVWAKGGIAFGNES